MRERSPGSTHESDLPAATPRREAARVAAPATIESGSRRASPAPARSILPAATALCIVAALSPLALTTFVAAKSPWPDPLFDSDLATIEIAVREVAALDRSVGAYSRFGWAQPGPAGLAALVPAYQLLGGRSSALIVGALALNLFALAAALAAAWRHLGRAPAAALALGALVLQLSFTGNEMASPWPPFQSVCLVFWAIVAAAAVAVDRAAPVGEAALAATLAVQTHVGNLPVVATTLALALLVRRVGGTAGRTRGPLLRRWAVAAAVLTAILWIPPVLEQAGWNRYRPARGNLSAIRHTLLAGDAGERSLGFAGAVDLLRAASAQSELALSQLLPSGEARSPKARAVRRADGPGLGEILVASLLMSCAVAALRRDHTLQPLAAVALGALAASVVAASRIVGPPLHYLVTYALATAAFALAVVSVTAWRSARIGFLREPRRRWIDAGVAALLMLASVYGAARAIGRQEKWVSFEPDEWLAPLAKAAVAAAAPGREAGCLRVGAIGDTWAPAVGVFLALERAGFAPAIDPSLSTLLGARYLRSRDRCRDLRLVARDSAQMPPGGVTLLSTPTLDLVRVETPGPSP